MARELVDLKRAAPVSVIQVDRAPFAELDDSVALRMRVAKRLLVLLVKPPPLVRMCGPQHIQHKQHERRKLLELLPQ